MDIRVAVSSKAFRRLGAALPLLICCSSSLAVQGIEPHTPLRDFTDHLDKQITALMKDYEIPGVNIAVIKKGETVWSKAYGYADVAQGRKMTTDTRCRVESISKPVTAWGVMKLVEQGKMELDKPAVSYLKNWNFPESKFPAEQITVRQLLSHTAGLPLGTIGVRYAPDEERPSLKQRLSKDAVVKHQPGRSFSYSNTGFNLLELLIEEVTRHDFAEYMAEEILAPLGMHHSSFVWSDAWDPPVPVGYDLKGRPVPVYVYPEKGAGGLFATVEDIAAFVTAGMSNFPPTRRAVLSSQAIHELYTPVVKIPGLYGIAFDSYGLGHFIETLPDGSKAVSHGGQGSGWMTHFHSVPETGDAIVILTNSQRSWPFFARILTDWAKWNGFYSVGMGNIVYGQKILWGLIWLFLFGLLWQTWRLVTGVLSGARWFAPLSSKSRPLRLIQSGFAAVLLSALLWAANQHYLVISSLFPVASVWLGYSIFLSAMVLLLSALFSSGEK